MDPSQTCHVLSSSTLLTCYPTRKIYKRVYTTTSVSTFHEPRYFKSENQRTTESRNKMGLGRPGFPRRRQRLGHWWWVYMDTVHRRMTFQDTETDPRKRRTCSNELGTCPVRSSCLLDFSDPCRESVTVDIQPPIYRVVEMGSFPC